MRSSISSFDEAIAADVINLFPGGCEGGLGALESLDDDAIRAIVNDYDNGLQAYAKAKLCMCGTTALVALVDEVQENLWVANLGDCQAGSHALIFSVFHHILLFLYSWSIFYSPCDARAIR